MSGVQRPRRMVEWAAAMEDLLPLLREGQGETMTAKRDRDGNRPARYESMKEMAAQTGIPLDLLKHSKDEGCTFNSNNRYDLLVWLRWYFARPEAADGENWDRRKKKVDALLKER